MPNQNQASKTKQKPAFTPRYYDLVVACAQHRNDPKVTYKDVTSLVTKLKELRPDTPLVKPKLLKQAWKEFNHAQLPGRMF